MKIFLNFFPISSFSLFAQSPCVFLRFLFPKRRIYKVRHFPFPMMNRISSIARTLTLANCVHQMYISSLSHRKVFCFCPSSTEKHTKSLWLKMTTGSDNRKKRTKLQWVHLRSTRNRHRCVPNSYASLRPYSAVRTKRFDLVVPLPKGMGSLIS